MNENQLANTMMSVQMGYSMVIIHLFHCLHSKGILPLSEAATSLDETVAALPPSVAPGTLMVMQAVATNLRDLAGQNLPTDPSKPPPPTRPTLRIIQGGLST
jgi:hypothetical protein